MSKNGNPLAITPSGFVGVRTPTLPWNTVDNWSAGLEAPKFVSDPNQLEQALARDRSVLRERLRTIVADPAVREALFVASPSLEEQLDTWFSQPESESGQKIERTLVRYLARMSGRATPFGLFSGHSVARIGDTTNLTVEARAENRRHTRLDMEYVMALVTTLAADPSMRPHLNYYPNTSLYKLANRLHYAEATFAGGRRLYNLVAVDDADYLQHVLTAAESGATLNSLAQSLVHGDFGVTEEEALLYLNELVDSQILVPDLSMAVTGPEPMPGLISQLTRHPSRPIAAAVLQKAKAQLAEIDAAGLGNDPEQYREIARQLRELPVPLDISRLFQVDMTKPAPNLVVGQEVVTEVIKGISILYQLSSSEEENAELKQFRQAFQERYEAREVPLVEALDEELGIGFAGREAEPLLNGFAFGRGPGSSGSGSGNRSDAVLLGLLTAAVERGEQEIRLTERDLEHLAGPTQTPLANALSAMVTIATSSPESMACGDFRVLVEGVNGPSGANLLGRFCHADSELLHHVQGHIREEEALDPEAIYAEIVHWPQDRVGNILLRPVLREYEIPFLGQSSAPREKQIPITDLMVSVRGHEIILRSKKLGRRVVPRLTTAHNFMGNSLGLYRFLCLLQNHRVRGGYSWRWGGLSRAPFLPRVVAGKVVLCTARWNINGEELRKLGGLTGARLYHAVQDWRKTRKLPRFVMVKEADNELPIDLDNVLSVETFVQLTKKRPSVELVEMYPGPDQLSARGPEGRYVHELLIPFVRSSLPAVNKVALYPARRTDAPDIVRAFSPGSEWLYAKIYTGSALADQVLTEAIRPVVEAVTQSAAIDRWFFVRYADPHFHLRVRFHGEPGRLAAEVLPLVHEALKPFCENGRVWKVQLDTYEREIERYGGPLGMLLAEELFCADSDAALEILTLFQGAELADKRWRLTLVGMDQLLADLGMDLPQRHSLLKLQRDAFGQEFNIAGPFKGALGERFRVERSALEPFFGLSPGSRSLADVEAFRRRSRRLAQVSAELRAAHSQGGLTETIQQLASSYLHMHANRMLRSAHRKQELVIYDFLARLYLSITARAKEA